MNIAVRIKKSKIHGLGVFAARNFRKGEVVMRWDVSHRLTKKNVSTLSSKLQGYVNRDTHGRLILLQSPERFVNHSDHPNTKVRRAKDVAIRDIQKGEEITGNYLNEGNLPGTFIAKLKRRAK